VPYIKITANTPIPADKRETVKTHLGKDIEILGKNEMWLMVDFCENSPLYFNGTNGPAAIASLDLLGTAKADAYNKFTAAVTDLLHRQLSIPPDRIFVKYGEYKHWGLNGENL